MVSIMVSIMASIMASIMVTAKAMKGRASGASLRYAPSPSQRKPRGVGWCLVGAKLARASLRQRYRGQGQACAQG